MAIQIVVDSAADYEKEEIEQIGLVCVPLTVSFGEEHYKDCVQLTKKAFYERLQKEYPKTSQPSPEEFLHCFQEAEKKGDIVIAILLSSGLSGTYQSACLAKELSGYEKIYLIDSKTATAGIRLLVEAAVRMLQEGKSAKEIVDAMEALKEKIKIRFAINDLKCLYKGGRLTKAQTGIAEFARLKPIIQLNSEGKIEMMKKCIGTKKVMTELANYVLNATLSPNLKPIFIYSYEKENCLQFIEYLKGRGVDIGNAECYNMGPTIGAHVGLGSFGCVYVEEK